MTVHLLKLSVGSQTVDDLKRWIARRSGENRDAGRGRVHDHATRMRPRREAELLDGGSIYWVIKGVVLARQPIIGLEPRTGRDGVERTAILLEPKLVLTEPQPRRAFQGWRYLEPEDAPADIARGGETSAGHAALRAELAELGLL